MSRATAGGDAPGAGFSEGSGGMSGGPPSGGEGPSRLRLGIALALGLAGTVLLGLLLYPFLPALVTSAVLATLFFPAHQRVRGWIGQRDVAALLSTTAVFFLVLVPAILVSVVLIDNVRQGVEWLRGVVESATAPGGWLTRAVELASTHLDIEAEEMTGQATDELSRLLGLLARRTFTFLSGLGGWLLQAGAALFTLFYFLRDGDGFMRTVKWLIPLDAATTDRLVLRTKDVIFATVWGNVAVAIVQGGLGGLAFWILGLPAAALWGSVMGVLSLLPVVGPMMVWLPGGLILLFQGEIVRGLLLLAFGGGIISTVDNYLRAVIIGERAEMHSLVVFFSVLAGLFAFGAVGIFVGPVVFVIAFSVIEVARVTLDAAEGSRIVAPGAGDLSAGSAAPGGILGGTPSPILRGPGHDGEAAPGAGPPAPDEERLERGKGREQKVATPGEEGGGA